MEDSEAAKSLIHAVEQLEEAKLLLLGVLEKESYTLEELKKARKMILLTVRQDIDPLAHFHMPHERHY